MKKLLVLMTITGLFSCTATKENAEGSTKDLSEAVSRFNEAYVNSEGFIHVDSFQIVSVDTLTKKQFAMMYAETIEQDVRSEEALLEDSTIQDKSMITARLAVFRKRLDSCKQEAVKANTTEPYGYLVGVKNFYSNDDVPLQPAGMKLLVAEDMSVHPYVTTSNALPAE